MRLIEAGALDRSGVDALAERLGVGPRHMSRLFDRHLGASPARVARTLRTQRAKRLLDRGGRSVRDIADATGFASERRLRQPVRATALRLSAQKRAFLMETTMTLEEAWTRANLFQFLHDPGRPVLLFNICDAGSARSVASAGGTALATGSWSVAQAYGHDDGEALPLDPAIANLARIAPATDLPVTIDLQRGRD